MVADLKELRRNYDLARESEPLVEIRRQLFETYKSKREDLRNKRDEVLAHELRKSLELFERKLQAKTFTFGLYRGPKIGDRQTYVANASTHVQFASKQVAAVIKRGDSVAQQSRNSIIRALKQSLQRDYTYSIYRIDIQKFYESISQSLLLEKLQTRGDIDRVTLYVVTQLLDEYNSFEATRLGVPQGIDISAALADFYLRDFDFQMRGRPGVLFYARYVDDIVFVLEDERVLNGVIGDVDRQLSDLSLSKNAKKTIQIVSDKDGRYKNSEFVQYLGYTFHKGDEGLTTGLSEDRFLRRVTRLETAFEIWARKALPHDPYNTGLEGLLIDRVRYLASNTQLTNSKSNVSIGLYFSNSALDPGATELKLLDDRLTELVEEYRPHMSDRLIRKLSSISFETMFETRPFLRFENRRLAKIVQCWRNLP